SRAPAPALHHARPAHWSGSVGGRQNVPENVRARGDDALSTCALLRHALNLRRCRLRWKLLRSRALLTLLLHAPLALGGALAPLSARSVPAAPKVRKSPDGSAKLPAPALLRHPLLPGGSRKRKGMRRAPGLR